MIDFGREVVVLLLQFQKVSLSHDIWCEGDGMKQSCSGTHRTGVSHSSSTTVTIDIYVYRWCITEFKMVLVTQIILISITFNRYFFFTSLSLSNWTQRQQLYRNRSDPKRFQMLYCYNFPTSLVVEAETLTFISELTLKINKHILWVVLKIIVNNSQLQYETYEKVKIIVDYPYRDSDTGNS